MTGCEWCGRPLPGTAQPGQRYCSRTHRTNGKRRRNRPAAAPQPPPPPGTRKQRADCKRKTARGGVYRTQDSAAAAARGIRHRSGIRMYPYRCPVCGLFHLTGTSPGMTRDRLAARRMLARAERQAGECT